jgi:hypothetical protein
MPQEFQSSVRTYKYPFELIMKVSKLAEPANFPPNCQFSSIIHHEKLIDLNRLHFNENGMTSSKTFNRNRDLKYSTKALGASKTEGEKSIFAPKNQFFSVLKVNIQSNSIQLDTNSLKAELRMISENNCIIERHITSAQPVIFLPITLFYQ